MIWFALAWGLGCAYLILRPIIVYRIEREEETEDDVWTDFS